MRLVPWPQIVELAGRILKTPVREARFRVTKVEPDGPGGSGWMEITPESTGKPRLITGAELERAYALRLPTATPTSFALRRAGVSKSNPAYILAVMLAAGSKGRENEETSGAMEYRLCIWAVMDQEQKRGRYEATLERWPAGDTVAYGKTSSWAGTRQGALLEGFVDLLRETEPGCRLTVVNPYNSPAVRTVCLEDHRLSEKRLYQDVFRLLNQRACRVQAPGGPAEERPYGLPWGESPTAELVRLQDALLELETQRSELAAETQELREKLAGGSEQAHLLHGELNDLRRQLNDLQTATPGLSTPPGGAAPASPYPPASPAPSASPSEVFAVFAPDLFAAVSARATADLRARFTGVWSSVGPVLDMLHEALFLEIIVGEDAFGNDSYVLPAFALSRACECIANHFLAAPLLRFLQEDQRTERALHHYLRAISLSRPSQKDRCCNLSLRDIRLILFDPDGNRLAPRPVELADRVGDFLTRSDAPWLAHPLTKKRLGEVNEIRNRSAHENEPVSPGEYRHLRDILLEAQDALLPRFLTLSR